MPENAPESGVSETSTETNSEPTTNPVTGSDLPIPADQQVVKLQNPFAENTETEEAPSWMWNESTPGTGAKPDWYLGDKYKSVEEQAKALPHAEQTIGRLKQKLGGFTGAPDKYDFSGLEIDVNTESEAYQKFENICRTYNVSQEMANEFAKLYTEAIQEGLGESAINFEEEYKALGENADIRVQQIKNFANNLLGDKSAKLVNELMEKPMLEYVVLFEEIKELLTQTVPPDSVLVQGPGTPQTVEDLMKHMVDNLHRGENLEKKFQRDPAAFSEFMKKIKEMQDGSGK